MAFRCLFHIHTRHSFDSLLSPQTILARARAIEADLLIVTDHESMRGSEDVARIAKGNPKFVIGAGEYKSEKGDLIGLFLKDEITSRKSNEVIQQIQSQGGLVVLPHPYKGHKMDDELLGQVDLVEIYNSRCSESQNHSAGELAHRLGKPALGGCDAHCAAEIGVVTTEFSCEPPSTVEELRKVLLTAPRKVTSKRVSSVYQPYSQLIKACKTRSPILFVYQLKQLCSVFVKEVFSQ